MAVGSFNKMIRSATGRNAVSAGGSASYQSYQKQKTQPGIDERTSGTNTLPPGNRIGPKNKVSGFNPGPSNSQMKNFEDDRVGPKHGYGGTRKANMDRKAKKVPFTPSPTSERASSGKPGVAKYAGSKKGSK